MVSYRGENNREEAKSWSGLFLPFFRVDFSLIRSPSVPRVNLLTVKSRKEGANMFWKGRERSKGGLSIPLVAR